MHALIWKTLKQSISDREKEKKEKKRERNQIFDNSSAGEHKSDLEPGGTEARNGFFIKGANSPFGVLFFSYLSSPVLLF